jgi:hypothetical protein
MPKTINNKVVFSGGEALPEVGSQAYVAAQEGQYNPINSYIAGKDTPPPNFTPDTSLSANEIGTVKPYRVPTIPKDSNPLNLTAGTIAESASIKPPEQQNNNDLRTRAYEILGVQKDRGDFTLQAQQDAQLAQKRAEETKVDNEIIALKKSYQDKIKNVNRNGALTREQAAVESDAIAREGEERLANKGIEKLIAQNDVNGALKIVEDKVNAKFKPLDDELQYIQQFIKLNNEDLTESQKFELTQQANRKEKNIGLLQDVAKTVYSAVAQNGATSVIPAVDKAVQNELSKMQSDPNYIPNPATVYSAAGIYAGDLLDRQYKQAQIKKMETDAAKALSELGTPIAGPMAKAQAQGNIGMITGLAANPKLDSAVGPNPFGRASFTNLVNAGKSNFIAGVQQMTSQLTLDKLIEAKKNGATFGSLTEGERAEIASAATKINQWAIKNEKGEVIGYKTTESEFKKELNKIANYAKLDFIIKGGDPESVGVKVMDDNTYWTQNGDGTFTQLNAK